MPMKPIFVSYKRVNKKAVFDLIKKIEDRLKVQCWVDLDGIESSVQFASKICNAIDDSKVFLFMHSSAHLTIDFEEDYTIKELSYARMTHKKVILVKLDDAPLENYFLFEFGSKNYRDISDDDQFERLLSDILKYLKPSSAGYNRNSSAKQHNGNPSEQNDRGVAYYYGNGVKQDYNEAAKWFRKAAEQGNADAQNNLGLAYFNGNGVPQDYNEAAKWSRKAAEQGNADAQNNLGLAYFYGNGVPQDYNGAVKWYRKAADQGNAYAQNNLGLAYFYGNGVPQDYNEAAKWFRKAADDGHHWAQYNMGFCYEFGHGVPKNFSLAESFYKKAAESGHKNAIDALKRFKY